MRVTGRNPYTVGGPVRGSHFYGRTAMIQAILEGNDRAIWVIGNRRSGKTSLLRRLEEFGNADGRVTFRISMEAADTVADLAQSFLDDIDQGDDRLERLGLTLTDLRGKTPSAIMRLLDRRARDRNIEVLLLLDEAEALIGIAEQEGDDILKDLRREMQRSDALRVVMVATKRLAALNDMCRHWDTSPFLYGIIPRYLGRLEHDEALALIRQTQSPAPLTVDDLLAEQIVAATNGHPFLTQWLCDRLWTGATLRPLTPDDLIPDERLDLTVSARLQLPRADRAPHPTLPFLRRSLDEAGLLEQLGVALADIQLRYLVQSLTQLCYVRRAGERYSTGNQLLHNWLQFWAIDEPTPPVSDAAAVNQADEQQQEIIKLATAHKRRLRVLEEQEGASGQLHAAEIVLEIQDIQAKGRRS